MIPAAGPSVDIVSTPRKLRLAFASIRGLLRPSRGLSSPGHGEERITSWAREAFQREPETARAPRPRGAGAGARTPGGPPLHERGRCENIRSRGTRSSFRRGNGAQSSSLIWLARSRPCRGFPGAQTEALSMDAPTRNPARIDHPSTLSPHPSAHEPQRECRHGYHAHSLLQGVLRPVGERRVGTKPPRTQQENPGQQGEQKTERQEPVPLDLRFHGASIGSGRDWLRAFRVRTGGDAPPPAGRRPWGPFVDLG